MARMPIRIAVAVAALMLSLAATAQAANPLSVKTARILTAAYGDTVVAETGRVEFTSTGVGQCTRQAPRQVTCVLRARGVDTATELGIRCTLDVVVRQAPKRVTLSTPRDARCGVVQ